MIKLKPTKHSAGFTLIELVVVLVILAVLALTALPRLLSFQSQARENVIEMTLSALKTGNDNLYTKTVIGRDVISFETRQAILDMNQNGVYDDDSNTDRGTLDGKDGPDIIMIHVNDEPSLGWTVDNYHVMKVADISGDLAAELDNPSKTYIGFDLNGDGKVVDDSCLIIYNHRPQDRDGLWSSVTSGC